ncbi:MAG: ATP-binding protein [Pedosphaera sp.]|nr:ATP-binding protein [Pedosphaera sp.]
MNTQILSRAMEKLLGRGADGDLAFTRAFSSKDIELILTAGLRSVSDWRIVAVGKASGAGWVTADQAVELRESKGPATFLLIDTHGAGAGMDGIYSAAREIDEKTLFKEAISILQRNTDRSWREFAEEAIKRARRLGGRRNSTSLRQEFEFFGRLSQNHIDGGRLVHILGLWPVVGDTAAEASSLLAESVLMVEKLLMPPATGQPATTRISGLVLSNPSRAQLESLETIIRNSGSQPRAIVLETVGTSMPLWLGNLRPAFLDSSLARVEIISWRRPNNNVLAWSGLRIVADENLPQLIIDRDNPKTKLEIRWTTKPEALPRGSVNYEVRVCAGSEILASRQIEHSGKSDQKVIFTQEDFEDLDSSSKLEAFIEVTAAAQTQVVPVRTEDFIITFGEAPVSERVSSGEILRCLADGLIQANSRDEIESFLEQRQKGEQAVADKHGFVTCRLPGMRRGFRVERSRLLQEVEKKWSKLGDVSIGRWVIRCRADGFWTSNLEFKSILNNEIANDYLTKLKDVSRRFRDNALKAAGALSRFYLHGHGSAALTSEYLNAWQTALESGDPQLALAHTVEVQNPAGRITGLIVLPSHPIRVAWQSAYDELAFQMRFEEQMPPRRIRQTLGWLDAAHFPFILPGIQPDSHFVFGDVLGFAAVAMVADRDREPKSAIATLAACFAGDSERIVPGLSANSGVALAREVSHYLDSHPECSVVRVHALRPGDAGTVVRALGKALSIAPLQNGEPEDGPRLRDVGYQLDLHPTEAQSGAAGAHLVKINQRRRAGVARVPEEDAWSLESLSRGGGRVLPRLRWARRDPNSLNQPAHLAIAFDSFTSQVTAEEGVSSTSPILAYGLVANLQRIFSMRDSQPTWRLFVPLDQDGLKLPNRVVTERLQKVQNAIASAVSRWAGVVKAQPLIRTIPSGDDVEMLDTLHRLCDWVVTVDRNAGVEYFDSPLESPAVYDAYLIDAVPERDDLGCLQMITSTAHFDEVRHLLDQTLALMGLSGSMRNCEYLLGQLKGLSGRLAMRLAAGGDDLPAKRVGAELVALSLVRANCLSCEPEPQCWLPLSTGFLVPLDDVRDLLPAEIIDEEECNIPEEDPESGPESSRRADILFVSVASKGRLQFRFAEVKYRRHLAMARAAALVSSVLDQTRSARTRWMDWFFGTLLKPSERTIRAGRLVRALRFYADKARRHHLDEAIYNRVCAELDRLLREPTDYEPYLAERSDRAFIFCPDFAPTKPEELFPGLAEECRVWLFGPGTLPDKPKDGYTDPARTPPPPPLPNATATPLSTLGPDIAGFKDTPSASINPRTPASSCDITNPAQTAPVGTDLSSVPVVPLGDARGGPIVTWSPSITSNPHLMIAGLPGMGKTTCLINICKELVAGNVLPIVFSYHDDIDEKLANAFPDLSCSDGRSLGFNPMRVTHDGPLAHVESAGQLRDIFSAIFPDLGDLQLEQLRGAIKASYQALGWGNSETAGLQPPQFRSFVEILRRQERPDARAQTLLARLSELDDFQFFRGEQGAKSLLDSTHPQILRVHVSKSDAVQRAYASFALYSIYQDMFRRGRPDRITHAVIFDEAHRAAKLKLIPTMAKECRKYGLAMIVASQEAKDFDSSLYSAIANYLILRVTDQDARTLARNVAPSEIERRTADRLKTLKKYEALFFSEGQRQPIHLQLKKN